MSPRGLKPVYYMLSYYAQPSTTAVISNESPPLLGYRRGPSEGEAGKDYVRVLRPFEPIFALFYHYKSILSFSISFLYSFVYSARV